MRSERLVLGFDTSAAHCAAALLCGDAVLAEAHEVMARGQAERLMPLLDALMAQAGAVWGDLAALAVGIGPGNFTGIRIAVSAARGLSLGLGIPAHGVSVFEARAEGLSRPIVVAEDARREEVYVQDFAPEPGTARLLAISDVQGFGVWPVTGTAAEAFAARTGGPVVAPLMSLAVAIARIGARRQAGPRPAPLYLRAADAAPPSDRAPQLLP